MKLDYKAYCPKCYGDKKVKCIGKLVSDAKDNWFYKCETCGKPWVVPKHRTISLDHPLFERIEK